MNLLDTLITMVLVATITLAAVAVGSSIRSHATEQVIEINAHYQLLEEMLK